jgi:hypothetical protein
MKTINSNTRGARMRMLCPVCDGRLHAAQYNPDTETYERKSRKPATKEHAPDKGIDEGDGVPRYTVAGDAGMPPVEIVQLGAGIKEAVEESPGDPVDEDESDEPVYCAIDQALADLSERLRQLPKPVENQDLKIRVLEALRDLLDPEIGRVLGEVAEDLRWAA